jgi:hypothetical protein
MWWNRLYAAQQVRYPYSWRWGELTRYYMNDIHTLAPPGMEWMHTEMREDAFNLVEGYIPNLAAKALSTGLRPIVNAHTPIGEGLQLTAQEKLYLSRRRASFEQETTRAFRNLAITGHVTQLNFQHKEFGQRRVPIFSDPVYSADGTPIAPGRLEGHEVQDVVLFNGPMTKYPDQRFIWKSQARDWKGEPMWWIEMFALDLDAAYEVNTEYKALTGEDFYKDLPDLEHYVGKQIHQLTGSSAVPSSVERSLTAHASWIDDSMLVGPRQVIMLRCSGWVDRGVEEYDDAQWRHQVISPDGAVHRDEPYPSADYRPTYHDVPMIKVHDEPYGRTPLEWTIPSIVSRSELRNLKMVDIWMNVMPTYIARRGAGFDQGDFLKLPYGVWMYDDDELRPDEVLRVLERTPVLNETYVQDSEFREQQEMTMGSTANMRGDNFGQRTSASEAMNIDQKTGSRITMQAQQVSWDCDQKAMQDYWGFIQCYTEEAEEILVEGEVVRVHPSELQFNADISIDTNDYGPLNAVTIQGMQQLANMASINGEWGIQIDPKKVMREFAQRLGSTNILRDQSEIAAIYEQISMQQGQQMALPQAAGQSQS